MAPDSHPKPSRGISADSSRRDRPGIFLILRYTGMRRESVATLRVRHLDGSWGLRGVKVKGGKTRDIPVPAAVMKFLQVYLQRVLSREETVGPDTPLFWSSWGRRVVGKTCAPMTGKNIWRLCKVYGRLIGFPELKPTTYATASRWRSSNSITISSRSARCSVTRGSIRHRLHQHPPGTA
jgi:integrase